MIRMPDVVPPIIQHLPRVEKAFYAKGWISASPTPSAAEMKSAFACKQRHRKPW
jgi:hypothetical protein